MDIAIIIERIKKRDEKALSYLYDNYGSAINGIIMRILRSEKQSEEVLQQTFLKVWNKIESFDPSKSSIFTWMSRIARNSAIDVKRLKSHQNLSKTKSFDIVIHNQQTSSINLSTIDANSLISKLDHKHQIILQLVYLEGYTQSQVSHELQIPLGTVKTRVRNAILELRSYLKSEEDLFLKASFIFVIFISYLCL